jgi:hypothetical protein
MRLLPAFGVIIFGLTNAVAFGQIKTDWPMAAFDISHDGYNPNETTISPLNVPNLQLKWTYHVTTSGSAKGFFRAQPVIAANVLVKSQLTDLVLIGNNSGTFFALDANSTNPAGSVIWSRSVGSLQPSCPTTTMSGIIGTAVVDRAAQGGRGAVYVGANANVYAFDLATGADVPGWPVSIPKLAVTLEGFVHAGLTLFNGALYVANASKCDFDPYHGQIAVINTATPAVVGQWWTMSGSSALPSQGGGAIWGAGGVSIDPTPETGGVFAATGNGRPNGNPSEITPYAEGVVQLSPDISQIIGYHQPGYIIGDDDLASTATLLTPIGCSTPLLAAQRKSGELYVYRRNYIGVVRPQTLKVINSTGWWRGGPAWDPLAQLLLVTASADGVAPFKGGLIALRMTTGCRFALAWQNNSDLQGIPFVGTSTAMTPPTAANGVVYFAIGLRTISPQAVFKAYAIADQSIGSIQAGQTLWQSQQFSGQVESSPVVVNGMLFVGSFDQNLYAYSLFGK